MDSRRAWFMWTVGLAAYAVAVMQRTSFGVASLEATERFDAGASLVSLFVVVQLLTYAGMQVPAGVLVDRFGTRLVVACGAVLMCLGQLDLAFSTNVVSAIVARILVGAGDALTFTPVLRMLPAWFSPGRIPILNQLTAIFGQAGQLLSSIPLAAMLGIAGWTSTFTAAAAASALVAVVVLVVLRNSPPAAPVTFAGLDVPVLRQVADVLRHPASRVAFWIHWMCSFWGMIFALMWGYPFLMAGLGYSQQVASGLFTLLVLAGLPFGPVVGLISQRAPIQRTNLAMLLSLLSALPWLAVLVWPGPAPVWLLAILVIGLAASGPGSNIGFDVARASNPLARSGTASGFVIVGGFTAGLLNILVIGFVLDLLGGYTLEAFRWAMATQFLFWGVGVAGAYLTRKQARRLDRARGVRHPSLWSVLRRETVTLLAQWRLFRAPAVPPPRPDALPLQLDETTTVRVAAVLPGTGGELLAVDLAPNDATSSWWEDRVGHYLRLIDTPELQIGAIEVRTPDAATTADIRSLIASILARRGADLSHRVVTRRPVRGRPPAERDTTPHPD